MANPKIKWNIAGFREVRKSPEVVDMLQDVVDDILDDLGRIDYEGNVRMGQTRARGGIRTATWDGIRENDEENTLLKALARKAGEA